MPTEAELINTVEELRGENRDLTAQNEWLQSEVDSLRAYEDIRRWLHAFVMDVWHWKWVILLVVVELLRLSFDAQWSQQLGKEVRDIYGLIDNLVDAVAPGASRG